MSDLCWKCKADWEGVGTVWKQMIPFSLLHCHHEPKEKAKCWCDGMNGPQILRMIGYDIKTNFCPECGRRL